MREVKAWLKAHGLSQGELARRMKSDRHQVSRWLNGVKTPTVGTLKRFQKVTGLTLEQLTR